MQTKPPGESTPRAYQMPGSGSFVSVPDAFPDAAPDVRNAFKVQFWTSFSEQSRVQTLFSTDVALIDLRAVRPEAIDSETIRRDCELLAQAVTEHPDLPGQLVAELQKGDSDAIQRAAELTERAGLTDARFVKEGGGLFFLVVVAGAALLGGGCATLGSNKPFKQPTTPRPTPTPDAGMPDAGSGGGGQRPQ